MFRKLKRWWLRRNSIIDYKKYKDKSVLYILTEIPFSSRFLASFCAACMKSSISQHNYKEATVDPIVYQGIDLVERFGNGQDIDVSDLRHVTNGIKNIADNTVNIIGHSAYDLNCLILAVFFSLKVVAGYTSFSYYAYVNSYNAVPFGRSPYYNLKTTSGVIEDPFKEILLDLMETNLTTLEKLLLL